MLLYCALENNVFVLRKNFSFYKPDKHQKPWKVKKKYQSEV